MKISLVSDSTYDILSIDEIKSHIRMLYGQTVEDDFLNRNIPVAIEHAENYLNRKLTQKTYKFYLDEFPECDSIEIPYPPLVSIPSSGLVYTGSTGTSYQLSSSQWSIDRVSEPGRLVLGYDYYWPTITLASNNPISIEFTCGYGSTQLGSYASTNIKLPSVAKQAMLMMIGAWYENREDFVQTAYEFKQMPMGSKSLLYPIRVKTF